MTDLDNTLFDWFDIWFASFRPMVDALVADSGVPEAVLLAEIRDVHRHYGTSEYSRLIDKLPSLVQRAGTSSPVEVYHRAIQAFRTGRQSALRLYPTVEKTLRHLKGEGVTVVGYTESRLFYTNYRMRKLGLDGLLAFLYSPPDHIFSPDEDPARERTHDPSRYVLSDTVNRSTPEGERKPNPHILLSILSQVGAAPEHTLYVGDSALKDVAMAQTAGVPDVLAAYGVTTNRSEDYRLLQSVSHWSAAEIAQEQLEHANPTIEPTYILSACFADMLTMFRFGSAF